MTTGIVSLFSRGGNGMPHRDRPRATGCFGTGVLEIRDAAGTSLLLTTADWTAKERDMAMSAVLKLVGMKAATPPTREAKTLGSGTSAKGPKGLRISLRSVVSHPRARLLAELLCQLTDLLPIYAI
jgi:hypothetical protein